MTPVTKPTLVTTTFLEESFKKGVRKRASADLQLALSDNELAGKKVPRAHCQTAWIAGHGAVIVVGHPCQSEHGASESIDCPCAQCCFHLA